MKIIQRIFASASVVALTLSVFVAPAPALAFTDAIPSWSTVAINSLVDSGVLKGYSDGRFGPNDPLTRAQVAKVALLAAGRSVPASVSTSGFPDVAASDWSAPYVSTAKSLGILNGYADGRFGPNDQVTRAQAAKILANALNLPTKTAQGPSFPDVASSDWFYSYAETAYYWNVVSGINGYFRPSAPVTRAQIAVMTYKSQPAQRTARTGLPTSTETPTETTTPVVVSNAALSIRIAPDSPSANNIPQNGYNIPYTTLELTAGPEESVKITALTVTRSGLGSASNFAAVKLMVGTRQFGNEKSINTSENIATFNISNDPIVITKGTTKTVTIVGDMNGDTTATPVRNIANNTNKLLVQFAEDLTVVGMDTGAPVNVTGLFPLQGAPMTLSNAEVGKLTIDVSHIAGGDLFIGESNKDLSKVTVSNSSTEDVDLTMIKWKQKGTANEGDMGNYVLYQGSTKVAGPIQAVGDYVTFDLTNSPYFLERGDSRIFTLKGDTLAGINSTYGFDIEKKFHITGIGRVYGYGVNYTSTNSTPTTSAAVVAIGDVIKGGKISFAKSVNNPIAGEVARGAKDFVIGKFTVTTSGDRMTVKKLPFNIANDGAYVIKDVKLYNGSTLLSGPLDFTATGALSSAGANNVFNDEFSIEANSTMELTITADINKSETNGKSFTFYLGTGSEALDIENVDGDAVAAADITGVGGANYITGSQFTVAAPSITVTTDSAANRKAVVNAQDVELRSFNFEAGSASSVKITSIKLSASGSVATAQLTNNVNSLKLFRINADGSRIQIGSTKDLSSAGSATFSLGASDLVIAGGSTTRVVVLGTIPGTSLATTKISIGIDAVANIDSEDSEGNTVSETLTSVDSTTNGAATCGTSDGSSACVYIAAGASIEFDTVTSGTDYQEKMAATGDNNVIFTKFSIRETTNVEDVVVQKLRVRLVGANTSASTIALTGASAATGNTTLLTAGTATQFSTLAANDVLLITSGSNVATFNVTAASAQTVTGSFVNASDTNDYAGGSVVAVAARPASAEAMIGTVSIYNAADGSLIASKALNTSNGQVEFMEADLGSNLTIPKNATKEYIVKANIKQAGTSGQSGKALRLAVVDIANVWNDDSANGGDIKAIGVASNTEITANGSRRTGQAYKVSPVYAYQAKASVVTNTYTPSSVSHGSNKAIAGFTINNSSNESKKVYIRGGSGAIIVKLTNGNTAMQINGDAGTVVSTSGGTLTDGSATYTFKLYDGDTEIASIANYSVTGTIANDAAMLTDLATTGGATNKAWVSTSNNTYRAGHASFGTGNFVSTVYLYFGNPTVAQEISAGSSKAYQVKISSTSAAFKDKDTANSNTANSVTSYILQGSRSSAGNSTSAPSGSIWWEDAKSSNYTAQVKWIDGTNELTVGDFTLND